MSDERATLLRNCVGFTGLALVSAGSADLIPFWLGLVLGAPLCLAAAAVVQAVALRFRDYVYEETHFLPKLPSRERRYFLENSEVLETLGFEPLGDFCLLPEPILKCARIFISPDGCCLACLSVNLVGTSRPRIAYCSVTGDGAYLESASDGGESSRDPDAPLRLPSLDDTLSTAEALRQHREFVERYTKEAQTEVLRFRADQFRQVLDYGHRLSRWEQYQARNDGSPVVAEGQVREAGSLVGSGAEARG